MHQRKLTGENITGQSINKRARYRLGSHWEKQTIKCQFLIKLVQEAKELPILIG